MADWQYVKHQTEQPGIYFKEFPMPVLLELSDNEIVEAIAKYLEPPRLDEAIVGISYTPEAMEVHLSENVSLADRGKIDTFFQDPSVLTAGA